MNETAVKTYEPLNCGRKPQCYAVYSHRTYICLIEVSISFLIYIALYPLPVAVQRAAV